MSDALLREGMALHAQGRVEEAAERYQKVLKREPRNGNALNLAGVAARQKGELARALEFGRRAVAAQAGSGIFRANYGATLAAAGRLPEAVAQFREALASRPDDAVTLRNLGQALAAMGQAAKAVPILERAVAVAPGAAEAWLALAHARREAGDAAGARRAGAEAARLGDAALGAQARFLLAALGEGAAPERAPAAYVRSLFDQFAPRFDGELAGLGYATPAAIAAMLSEAGVKTGLDLLDLGCGTGLSGLALAPFAARMVGVDLSPGMLAEAAKRGCYAELVEADLVAWLPGQAGRFDLIVAADVLNYLGELGEVFGAMAGALRAGGAVAFSLEAGAAVPFELGEGMRYRHAPAHVASLLATAGFSVLAERRVVLRREKGADVAGVLFVARLALRAASDSKSQK